MEYGNIAWDQWGFQDIELSALKPRKSQGNQGKWVTLGINE